jgi:hypothetical protein
MSTKKEFLSTQTKAFYYKENDLLKEVTSYVVGIDGYNDKHVKRIM